jgi:rubrerythrin
MRGEAVPDLIGDEVQAADGDSRRRFLRAAGLGAAGAAALAVSACGGEKTGDKAKPTESGSQFGEGDVAIVNFALTLEYLEADFYSQVEEANLFSGKRADLLKEIAENEQEHVTALEATLKKLGGKPGAKPTAVVPIGRGATAVLGSAAVLENLGASAYLGQVQNILDREVLASALAIHAVEGRHAAALSHLIGEPFTTGAFAAPRSMDEALTDIKPFVA